MTRLFISLIVAMGIAACIFYIPDYPNEEIRAGLTLLALIAVLWVTEAIHVSVTALLIPVLAVLSGIFDTGQALAQFAHPVIYLFLGGFALAAALQAQNLDQRLADTIIKLAKGQLSVAVWLIFIATAFVSMWISNTATAAMMLPLALGLLSRTNYKEARSTYWFVLLGIAYSANIGGIGTLVGSPPNAIAAANTGISFADWLLFGLPAVCILLPITLMILRWHFRPAIYLKFEHHNTAQIMTGKQKQTLLVFGLTVAGWLLSKPLAELLGVKSGFDSIVALTAIVLLHALRLLSWKEFQHTANWGVLILFGGGLTLSAVLQASGASAYLGEQMIALMDNTPGWLFLLMLVGFVVFLTEITSNTASSALLIPIFIVVAAQFELAPVTIASTIAIAASCAFMLPVATPPNAIVFGSGYVPQRQMMRIGLVMNLVMIIAITLGVQFFIA